MRRSVVVAVVSLGSIALLQLPSSATRGSAPTTAPRLARSTASGRIFGPVTADRRRSNRNVTKRDGPQSETAVAVNPTDPDDILAASNDVDSQPSEPLYESTDGGGHWANSGIAIQVGCYDPWLDFNAAGDAFFVFECNANQQRYAYRIHGMTTWVTSIFPGALVGSFPDRDMIVVDSTPTSPYFNSVYIGYDDNGDDNAAYVLFSRDGTTKWKRSPKINDLSSTIGVNVSVAPDGTVYASWLDFLGQRLMIDRSTDGGRTWGTDRVVHTMNLETQGFFILIPPTPHRGIVPFPMSKAAPAGAPNAGRLYEAFEDTASPSSTDTNVYLTSSDDGGATWSTPTLINDDGGTAYQFFPTLAVAGGTIGVSFYDTRNDVTDHKTDQYFAVSTDGGATFGPNRKATTAQSDESGDGTDRLDYGDYEGLDAGPTGVFAEVWTDSRAGNLGEDMYFRKIRA